MSENAKPFLIRSVSPIFVLSQFPKLLVNFLAVLQAAQKQFGDCVAFRFPYRAVWFFHPTGVQEILDQKSSSFKKSENYRLLRSLLGESVITSDGEKWRQQRRAVAPLFQTNSVKAFFPAVEEISRRLLREASGKPELQLHAFLCQWSLAVASKCFFDAQFPLEAARVARLFDRGARSLFFKTIFRLKGKWADAVPWTKEYLEGVHLIDEWVAELVSKRKQELRKEPEKIDILSRMIATTEPKELRDQCVSILLAGHDTTALTLFWALWLLRLHPEVKEKCKREMEKTFPDRVLTENGIAALSYTELVLLETMRLYPVVNSLSREALEPVEIQGVLLEKGTLVQLAPWITHRHKDYWHDAEKFIPERFLVKIPEGAFFPFGLGPRACVGQGFALQQMKILLSELLLNYDSQFKESNLPEISPFLTLRPAHDSKIRMVKIP